MDRQEIRDFEALFSQNAWRRIVRDAEQAVRDREVAALQADNFEEVVFFKGEVQQLNILIGLEYAVAIIKAQLDEDE